jgi:hypothetical protein
VKNSNLLIFNRVFSRKTLIGFINNYNPSPYVVAIKRISTDPENKTNRQIISEIYQYMTGNYRNEYIYKNTLINKLLFNAKNHSIENTTALTEIPVGKSKADFILINGIAKVYEIKTELDNFDRLESQMHDYYRAFDYVNVVTSQDKITMVKKLLSGTKTGIYLLDKNLNLNEEKKAICERKYLDHKTIFKILRRKEYENILIAHCGSLPDVSQFDYYKECFKKFTEIDIKKAYSYFRKELKKRCIIEKQYFTSLPNQINSLVYFSNIKKADIEKLSLFLNSTYNGGQNVLSLS